MFCTNCGAELPEGTKFCTSCGTPVAVDAPVTEAAAASEGEPTVGAAFEASAQEGAQKESTQEGGYQQSGDPQSAYQPPVYSSESRPLKSMAPYLTWAIIVTVLCCWPLGIPAIVNASRINKCNDAGDYAGAEEAARKSKNWTIASAIVGFVLCGAVSAIAFLGALA